MTHRTRDSLVYLNRLISVTDKCSVMLASRVLRIMVVFNAIYFDKAVNFNLYSSVKYCPDGPSSSLNLVGETGVSWPKIYIY